MKRNLSAAVLLVFLLCTARGNAQLSEDSLRARFARHICKNFNFSDSSATVLLGCTHQLLQGLSLVKAKTDLTLENRASQISALESGYERQIKGLFTATQWKEYEGYKDDTRKQFLDRMKGRNVTVKELPK